MFRAGAVGLFPPRPLVSNIGEDTTATHKPSRLVRFLRPLRKPPVMAHVPLFPAIISVDAAVQGAVADWLRVRSRGRALARKLKSWLK